MQNKSILSILILFFALAHTTHAQLGDFFDDIGDHISNAVDEVGNGISNGFDEIGDNVSNGVDNIGDGISNGVDEVGDGISNAADDVGNIFSDGVSGLLTDAGLSIASDFFGIDLDNVFKQLRDAKQNSGNGLQSIEVMDVFNNYDITELCNNCQELVAEVRDHGEHEIVREALKEVFEELCERHMESAVCSEYVRSFGDIIIDSMRFEGVSTEYVCQRYAMCPYPLDQGQLDAYVQEVLQDKPEANVTEPTGRATYQILHVTDIHIDFLYQEGTNVDCGGFQCCRAEYGTPSDSTQGAGYWGSLGTCDLPLRTFDQFVQFARDNLNVSMIVWTGDNIDHQLWDQFQANQTIPTLNITQSFLQNFPNATVYPIFGNHEAFPSDQFDTVNNESAWITQETGEMWEPWLDAEALQTYEERSFYSEVNNEHNFKLISLDTQVCDTLNFYLIRDTSPDPLGELAWLQSELADAESRNLTVFIMGHIPPSSLNCDALWGAKYKALIDRFSNIIKGQFFGHTHNDQFTVVRSYTDDSPIGTIFITPALSTYISLNPSFRVYEIDADTNQPVNYYQYRLNLTKWNSNTTGPIEWDLAYNFLDEYNMTDMSPASFDALTENIRANSTTSETYNYNFNSGGIPSAPLSQREVDYNYCGAKSSTTEQIMKCMGLDPQKTNLLYFAASYVPGLLTSTEDTNNDDN